MKIAIIGTRGIPGCYGGFETLADELSEHLVERGHKVTVYCRRPFTTPDDMFDRRIRRVILPTISDKHFDTLFHTCLSVLHVIFTDAEIILICNVANSVWAWIPRLFGKPTLLNVDGLDRKRKKWNFIGQWFLHLCEILSVFTPTVVITDAVAVQDYYRGRYGKATEMIGYGAKPLAISTHIHNFGLPNRRYILYVARLEPENNPELVLRAFRTVDTDWPLVVVGGNRYQPAYSEYLKSLADGRVIFTGAVYREGYWALQKNAGLFIFAGEIGGIHPALVEAMAAGNALLYLNTPANRETVRGCGVAFERSAEDLATKLRQLLASSDGLVNMRKEAEAVARQNYDWETVVDKYELLFRDIRKRKESRPE
jgi:glycosyltransferase involved in cell wall biosynthesis